ncbi:MAG: D-glycerate dehydrogenase [Alphaproteobacteria bacterium]|nr:D-glycerate dehydrogenase [Alphaproteobacteria bacterium]
MPPRPRVIVTRKLPKATEARMQELFDVTLNSDDVPFTPEQMIAAVKKADVLVPTVTDKLGKDILEHAGDQLRLIANFGVGIDHIDLATTQAKKITVTNTPSVLTEDTADIAMGLILAAPRRLSEAAALVRRNEWVGWTPTFLLGHRVSGKKLGIVGMGRIGQAVARRARGFGMEVHYHNRKPAHGDVEKALSATYWKNLDDMIAHVDILSLNCPYTPQTHHLINAERIEKMRKDSFVINTSRGAVIDEAALTDALAKGRIAGAGLDVYEKEPLMSDALRKLPNVVLLPHISSATIEGRNEMGEKVIINIKSYVDGHMPPDRLLLSEVA